MATTSPFRILSIDGGGIRGIIAAEVLIELERQIRIARNDDTIKIGECFDLIAGTSTGGILSLLLITPDPMHPTRARYSAEEALGLYLEHGDRIFDRSVWQRVRNLGGLRDEQYSADELEKVTEKYFGNTKLSDLIRPCMITAYATEKYRPFFFTHNEARADPSRDYYVRDVARATSAAPTYFEAAMPKSLDGVDNETPMIDGGVFANNPAACAFVEGMKINKTKLLSPGQIAILSLGTGRSPKHLPFNKIKDWGVVGWVRPLIDILMEGNAQTVDYQLKTIFRSIDCPQNYLRVDGFFGDAAAGLDIPELDADMDNASMENMNRLQAFGRRLAVNSRLDIGDFVRRFFLPPEGPIVVEGLPVQPLEPVM